MNQNRQAMYDRIRASSKDEVILEEMIAHGFWSGDNPEQGVAHEALQKVAGLRRELNALTSELQRLDNYEAMLKALRKRNMEQAMARRAETKARREAERVERAEVWRRKKQQDILFVGESYSQDLQARTVDAEALAGNGDLPRFEDAAQLAAAMGISIGELRWLTFGRKVSKTTHYQRFHLPKKSGGLRLISAPMPRLKELQSWVLRSILEPVPLHAAACGFRRGLSIVDNARPHVGAEIVVNIDLKDFFPTLTYPRVKGAFRKLGYSGQVATLLALLTTEPEMVEVALDGQRYWMAQGERHLPQGAPSSPALTNIICRGLDAALHGRAEVLGWQYSRYADDMTFSASGEEARALVGTLLTTVTKIVGDHGFTIHPDKTKVLRKNSRQEVTGIVVNEKLSLDRKTMRRFRAVMFQVEKDGPAGKRWGQAEDVLAGLAGYAHFIHMVDPERAAPFLAQLQRIYDKHGKPNQVLGGQKLAPNWQRFDPNREPSAPVAAKDEAVTPPLTAPEAEPEQAAETPQENKRWWKFW